MFVSMDIFWDILFQLMKHGTNPLHVAFIFLFVIDHHTSNGKIKKCFSTKLNSGFLLLGDVLEGCQKRYLNPGVECPVYLNSV